MESIVATLGASLVQSRLDYSNSIMYGMSASNMHKLQSAQNSLTRVVLPSLRHLSAMPCHMFVLTARPCTSSATTFTNPLVTLVSPPTMQH